jgi:hypothetical protein
MIAHEELHVTIHGLAANHTSQKLDSFHDGYTRAWLRLVCANLYHLVSFDALLDTVFGS